LEPIAFALVLAVELFIVAIGKGKRKVEKLKNGAREWGQSENIIKASHLPAGFCKLFH
jgi:hypothetical protein